jgi:hypothetical protein
VTTIKPRMTSSPRPWIQAGRMGVSARRQVAAPVRIWRTGAAVSLDFKAAHFERLNTAIFDSSLGAAKSVAPRAFGSMTLRRCA